MHAYTRTYGEAARPSTRPKDLVDILLIAHAEHVDAAQLRNALDTTFGERAQQPLPTKLPPPPASWTEPYQRVAAEVDVEPNVDKAWAEAAAFLNPILAGYTTGLWNPLQRSWQ